MRARRGRAAADFAAWINASKPTVHELGLHECTFDASQLKEEAVLSKLPRTTHRIPYRDLDKAGKWHERYFVARREFLFWSRIDKEERFPIDRISVSQQNDPATVFLNKALRLVLALDVRLRDHAGEARARMEIAFMSHWQWHFWHTAFAHGHLNDKRGQFVKYRIHGTKWHRRYMRIVSGHVIFIKLKLPVKVWPLYHAQAVLLPDRKTIELHQTQTDSYLYLRNSSPEQMFRFHKYMQEQIAHINEVACHSPLLAEYLRHPTHPMQLPIYVLNVIRDVEDNVAFLSARCPAAPFKRRDGTFNILAIDGGGLRGLIPAIILERLCDRFPRLLDAFDMIAGTSSGAILAAAMAKGLPPAALRTVLQALSKRIFVSSGFIGRYVPAVHAKFANDMLRLLCEGMWTDQQMKDIKRYLLIPYFSLDKWHIVAAHNLDPNEPTAQEKVADCVVRSAAAPSYFPAYQRCLDGATFAQNPAALAVVRAITVLMVPSERIRVLSVGTGRWKTELSKSSRTKEQLNWGLLDWLRNDLPSIVFDGTVQLSSDITQSLLSPGAYHRANPVLDKKVPLDSLAALPKLERAASVMDLAETAEWITQFLSADS